LFDGQEYTLDPHSQKKISIKPLKTYLYTVGDEEIEIKNSLSHDAHFLNPTKSQYFQINEIYCIATYSSKCRQAEKEKVSIFTAYKYYIDEYSYYVSELPEHAPICPEGIENPEIVSDEQYEEIMDA